MNLVTEEYRALAEFRCPIRKFPAVSEAITHRLEMR